jgi:hypothetical protein
MFPRAVPVGFAFTLAVIAASLTGCGPSGPKVYPISGTVNFDGKPVPDGDIVLMTPGEADEAGKIKDGKFAFSARAGNKKVKIMASRQEGPVDPQMGVAPSKPYIPAKYSTEKTELTMEVKESGENKFPFDLPP